MTETVSPAAWAAPFNPSADPAGPASAWAHPVAEAHALVPGCAMAVQLLGQAWVLWRDEQGLPRAAPDRCPHRGARLSLGQVCAGQLVCPYHGWHFAGDGRCTRVPALPGWQPPASHGLPGVCTLVPAHGLLWLRPDGLPPTPPAFAAESDERLRKLNVGPYEVATSAPRIVENFLDMAHFSTVHAGWLGDAEHPEVRPYTVTVSAEAGVLAQGCQAWQPQSNRLSTGGSWVDYDYRVPAPFTAVLEKAPQAQDGYRESIALFIQPLGPEDCRVWFRLAVPDWASTDAQLSAFQHTIFMQDAPVLLSQQPKRLPLYAPRPVALWSPGPPRGSRKLGAAPRFLESPQAPVQEVHCAADRSSAAYRRYLRALGWRYGVC